MVRVLGIPVDFGQFRRGRNLPFVRGDFSWPLSIYGRMQVRVVGGHPSNVSFPIPTCLFQSLRLYFEHPKFHFPEI